MMSMACIPVMTGKRRFIGDYMMGETLGKGVFGKVKMAVHPTTGEKVAIKIMDRYNHQQDTMGSYRREVLALSRVKGNTHIVHLYFYGLYEYPAKYISFRHIKAAVVAMEPVAGTLEKCLMEVGIIPFHVATDLFIQLMDAVAYCHSMGVYHRDIKPSNILISEEYRLLLADFGIAHVGEKYCHDICGSGRYMAPELINNTQLCYDASKADVWSAAICYFKMLTLHFPYYIGNRVDNMYRMLDDEDWTAYWEQPYLSSIVPGRAKHLISIILKTDPEKRPTSSYVFHYLNQRFSCSHVDDAVKHRNRVPSP